jgi:type IV fimbrial biogenesis protein FimT
MRSVKGFTLIELMVTIAIAGILAAIALPSFQNMIVSSRLNGVASDMVDIVSFARSESIKRNSTIRLCRAASATATSCAGTSGDWVDWVVLSGSTVLRRDQLNDHGGSIELTSTLTGDRVDFGSDGLARTGGNLVAESEISVCATAGPRDSIRDVRFGAASRVSVVKVAGACP